MALLLKDLLITILCVRVSGARRVGSDGAEGGPCHQWRVERHGGEQSGLQHKGLETAGETQGDQHGVSLSGVGHLCS